VSYANAFCKPVDPRAKAGLEAESATKLKEEIEALAKMYGLTANKRWLLSKGEAGPILDTEPSESLQAILSELEKEVVGG
jgi:hypothetical protein